MRARRLRANPWIRALVQQTSVRATDLIWAIVVHDGADARIPVPAMPESIA
jgi:porphobilinogen synthase